MLAAQTASPAVRARSAREARYELRYLLWEVTRLRSPFHCGRSVRSEGEGVGVHVTGDGRAALTGLQACGSVWACPVCSAHVRQERAGDIETGVTRWLDPRKDQADRQGERQHAVLMLTMTLRHRDGTPLELLLDALVDAWRRTIRGAPWQRRRDRLGIKGMIKSVEITHGPNGWHPHLHLLLFLDREPSDEMLASFRSWLHDRWAKFLVKCNPTYRPSREHGVRVQRVRDGEVGKYLAKVQDQAGKDRHIGLEMTRHDLKQGRRREHRLPFEILRDFGRWGDTRDRDLWHEYERATKGTRAIVWSRGLRDLLGLDAERTDEEIAADDSAVSDETLIGTLDQDTWRDVVAGRLVSQLLEAAEVHGWDGVVRVAALAVQVRRLKADRAGP